MAALKADRSGTRFAGHLEMEVWSGPERRSLRLPMSNTPVIVSQDGERVRITGLLRAADNTPDARP